MTNCREFVLDDLMAITAIPFANISLNVIPWQLTPTIQEDYFSPSLENAITIGIQPATVGGTLIPITRSTGKAKDDESDSVAGRMHSVTVTCEVDSRDNEIWDSLLVLERTPAHLLLSFRDNSRAFVSSTEDTYICTTERDGSKTSVTFKIQNLMGIQTVVSSSVDPYTHDIIIHQDTSFMQSDWEETDESSMAYIKNKPTLAKVATTGEYEDVKNRPLFDVNGEKLIIN